MPEEFCNCPRCGKHVNVYKPHKCAPPGKLTLTITLKGHATPPIKFKADAEGIEIKPVKPKHIETY